MDSEKISLKGDEFGAVFFDYIPKVYAYVSGINVIGKLQKAGFYTSPPGIHITSPCTREQGVAVSTICSA